MIFRLVWVDRLAPDTCGAPGDAPMIYDLTDKYYVAFVNEKAYMNAMNCAKFTSKYDASMFMRANGKIHVWSDSG